MIILVAGCLTIIRIIRQPATQYSNMIIRIIRQPATQYFNMIIRIIRQPATAMQYSNS
jgi:multisubunit Na+/H+ antiporter MnhF subunit